MRLLVTGGGGFLGKALAKALVDRGHEVRSFSRGDYPELKALGIEVWRGDLADEKALIKACAGCDAVFHVAAKAGVWGPYEEYYRTNVLGTKNVITACLQNKVKRLIFTSSPSVVFDNADQEGVNESERYPKQFLSHYPMSSCTAPKSSSRSKGLLNARCAPNFLAMRKYSSGSI